MKNLTPPFFFFWERHPALFFALVFTLSTLFAFGMLWALVPLCLIALLLYKKPKNLLSVFALFVLAWTLVALRCDFPKEPVEGTFRFCCESVTPTRTPFSNVMRYRGTAVGPWKLPCTLSLKEGPPANKDYLITGKLFSRNHRSWILKPDKKMPWTPVPHTFRLAEARYQIKKAIKRHLRKKIPDERSAAFLCGLATAEFDDPMLISTFKYLGLIHLLCISGFHFALIAFVLYLFSRLFLSVKLSAALLLVVLTTYYLFIGMTPPIERAWVAASVYLVGELIERKSNPLNSLGIALCILILWHPRKCLSLGFGFSYLATAAILLFYTSCNQWLQKVFPKRPFQQALNGSVWQKTTTIASTTLRRALALSVAVHLVVIPLSLFYFHRFPTVSLVTNLIFPPLFSLSLLLLIFAAPFFFFCPALETALHWLNSHYTGFLLHLTHSIPPGSTQTLYVEKFPPSLLTLYLSALFLLAIIVHTAEI